MNRHSAYRTVQQIYNDETIRYVKNLIWIYFWLLIFEGALRKWFFQDYSRYLLVIRDPILLMTYALAMRGRLFPMNGMMVWLLGLAVGSLGVGMLGDVSNVVVAMYGLRTNFFHFPLCFLMMNLLTREDVIKFGKAFLWLSLPMAILMVVQFMSPPTAFINNSVGSDVSQIRATVGNIRPPGTFSFITGVAEFLPLVTAYIIYAALSDSRIRIHVIIMSTVGLVIACVVSISRLAITGVSFVLMAGGIAGVFRARRLLRMLIGVFFVLFIALLLLQFDVIRVGFSTFGDRIQAAGGHEGGWIGYTRRILKVFIDVIDILPDTSIVGEGLGVGTQGGASLLTGKRSFLLSEGEWARVVFESGPIFGLGFLLWRVALSMYMFKKSWDSMRKGDLLPILLCAASLPLIMIGQLGRATTLGFTVISTGLCLAAIATSEQAQKQQKT